MFLQILPFRHEDEGKNQEMIEAVERICGTLRHAAYLLTHRDYQAIFGEEGFKLACQEHGRLMDRSAEIFRRLYPSKGEDVLFANTAQSIFQSATGKDVDRGTDNVRRAFRLFLSLVRRHDNEELARAWKKQKRAGRRLPFGGRQLALL